jgi:hypothetical protein
MGKRVYYSWPDMLIILVICIAMFVSGYVVGKTMNPHRGIVCEYMQQ